ncbi:MAG: ABC transporter ATP-binding protein [Gammaproteobacteria bacterium]|nr:ABC transporter ATP-binding protein [Gammaproteobacteria bacterium]
MTVSNQAAISVEALRVFAGQNTLLGPIGFHVHEGGTLVIIGETGAGKSLAVQAILGTLHGNLRAEGQITINGLGVDSLKPKARASLWGKELTTLPQEPWRALDPLMRSRPQVHETHRFVTCLPKQAAGAATDRAFDSLSLHGAERHLPSTLSGGMAQRVAFAAATAGGAPILLADEPTKGLDTVLHAKVVSLLAQVPKAGGALVVITHDIAVARRLGGEVLILKDGHLVEQGPTRTVLVSPTACYTKALIDADPTRWPRSKPNRSDDSVLKVDSLCVARKGRVLINNFSLSLHAGERVAITGPSGIGKTTLLDTLAGLLKPARGNIRHATRLAPTGIQKLYQDPPAAFPARVNLSCSLRDVARIHGVAWARVADLLSRLGVHPAILDRRPDEVSGGELQRISIARALTVGPGILLADEPTSRLDPITQRDTMNLLANIANDEMIAIILVTHDSAIAEAWANRRITLVSSS